MTLLIINNEILETNRYGKNKIKNAKIEYIASDNRIYKSVNVDDNNYIFKFNKINGQFDKLIETRDIIIMEELDLTKISDKSFYQEVLNIIKRRSILGYMVQYYKNKGQNLDKINFNNLYIGKYTHKSELAKIISKQKETNCNNYDISVLVENITKKTVIPKKLLTIFKNLLKKSIYRQFEIPEEQKNKFVEEIIKTEINNDIPEFINENIWQEEFYKIKNMRDAVSRALKQKQR